MEFVVIDTETTGLAPSARMIELAVVTLDADLRERSAWHSLIDSAVGPGPSWVHGIERSMLDGAPSFAEVAPTLALLLRGRVLVGHNLRFDWSVVQRSFERCGWQTPSWHGGLCTAELGREVVGRRLRLVSLCAELGVPVAATHRALPDARLTAEVLRALVGRRELRPHITSCGPFRPPSVVRAPSSRRNYRSNASGVRGNVPPEGTGVGDA